MVQLAADVAPTPAVVALSSQAVQLLFGSSRVPGSDHVPCAQTAQLMPPLPAPHMLTLQLAADVEPLAAVVLPAGQTVQFELGSSGVDWSAQVPRSHIVHRAPPLPAAQMKTVQLPLKKAPAVVVLRLPPHTVQLGVGLAKVPPKL